MLICPAMYLPKMADFARREIADYYGCCTGLDAEMGRLLSTLEDLDLADDTIVCYSSDHGDHLSSHAMANPVICGCTTPCGDPKQRPTMNRRIFPF